MVSNKLLWIYPLALFLLIQLPPANGQENDTLDYVVDDRGNYTYGTIIRYKPTIVRIKPAGGGKVLKFTPNNTQEFHVYAKQEHFVSLSHPKDLHIDKLFQERLISGPLQVFVLSIHTSGSVPGVGGGYLSTTRDENLFVRKGRFGKLIELDDRKLAKSKTVEEYRKDLLDLFRGDKEILDAFTTEGVFEARRVVDYIKMYNEKKQQQDKQ